MAQMIAKRAFKYGTRELKPDETFDAADGEVMTLIASDMATRSKPPDNRGRRPYKRRDMEAEE